MQFPLYFAAIFLLLPSFLLLVKLLKKQKTNHEIKKLPPGPMKFPFIGNLHQMVGSLPHHTLQKLGEKYGPIMHLQLGELSTIVVSSPKLAKDVLQTHGLVFASRPNLTVAKIISYDTLGVTFSPYGDYWRQMRQIYMMELLNIKNVRSFSSVLEDELSKLVELIKSKKGEPMNLLEVILPYLNSTISRSTVGRVYSDQGALIMAARETASLAGVFNLADLFPSTKILQFFGGIQPKLEKMKRKLDGILEDVIVSREKNRTTSTDTVEEDILDVLLRLEKTNEFSFPITRNTIKAIIFELSVAGSITSSVVVEWAMAEMMKNPRVMERAQSEIREAFKGKEKIRGNNEIQGLKYLKWVIKETLRLHPPGPLLAPRQSRKQCEIAGYIIPSGTVAIVNVWAIGRNPEYWNDPEVFEPERFIDSSIDFTGNNFELIPFGAGRRICPGIHYGVSNIELLLAQLLYHFNWELPGGTKPEELDMAERYGAAGSRKNELCLLANAYNPLC